MKVILTKLSAWSFHCQKKIKNSIKNFFGKCLRKFLKKLRIWWHMLKKSLMENFIFVQCLKLLNWCNISHFIINFTWKLTLILYILMFFTLFCYCYDWGQENMLEALVSLFVWGFASLFYPLNTVSVPSVLSANYKDRNRFSHRILYH